MPKPRSTVKALSKEVTQPRPRQDPGLLQRPSVSRWFRQPRFPNSSSAGARALRCPPCLLPSLASCSLQTRDQPGTGRARGMSCLDPRVRHTPVTPARGWPSLVRRERTQTLSDTLGSQCPPARARPAVSGPAAHTGRQRCAVSTPLLFLWSPRVGPQSPPLPLGTSARGSLLREAAPVFTCVPVDSRMELTQG